MATTKSKWKNLFHVETLDTRFASKTGEPIPNAQPSRWNTWEYYVYYAFHLTIPILMVKAVVEVSQTTHPTYPRYSPRLSPGWIFGRQVDNSDAQYNSFRDNIPYMAALLVIHPLLRQAYEAWCSWGSSSPPESNELLSNGDHVSTGASFSTPSLKVVIEALLKSDGSTDLIAQAANTRLERRLRFDLVFALIFIFALHGISALKILLILYANYAIATAPLSKRTVSILTWVFNVATLFANELTLGYRFGKIDPSLAWLDRYGGLIPRWEVLFNITVLRLIAYNFDYLWSRDQRASSPIEKKNLDPAHLSEKDRVKYGAKPEDFSFRNYLSYVLYSPLYLVGPIMNFNEYIAQCRYRSPSTSRDRLAPYATRFFLCLLLMEIVLHYMYTNAIFNTGPDWDAYSPFQITMLAYFNLHVIWLKLLLPWRFFRLWSLVDGMDPPENMVRCASDNYSMLTFWRGWHRSYNQWILRYIYIPLGGSRTSKLRAVFNFFVVFTFVALWHDINLRLLIWGWMVVIFVIPELIAQTIFPERSFKDRPNTYRWLTGVGGVANLCMIMAANLVGFAVGVDGFKGMVAGIMGTVAGRIFFITAYGVVFVGVQIMLEWRQSEARRGVLMKC